MAIKWDKHNPCETAASPYGFDSVVDTGSSMAIATAAAYDGTYGMEITYDDNTAAYGVFNTTNQATCVFSGWFNFHDIVLTNTNELIYFLYGWEAAPAWLALIQKTATGHRFTFKVQNDATLELTSVACSLNTWYRIIVDWKGATGAGADDGHFKVYLNGASIVESTGIDNDAYDQIDYVRMGMLVGDSTSPAGSFYMDECKFGQYELMALTARYHDHNFNAPQHFTIASNKVQMTARYRDYSFTAPEREGYG